MYTQPSGDLKLETRNVSVSFRGPEPASKLSQPQKCSRVYVTRLLCTLPIIYQIQSSPEICCENEHEIITRSL